MTDLIKTDNKPTLQHVRKVVNKSTRPIGTRVNEDVLDILDNVVNIYQDASKADYIRNAVLTALIDDVVNHSTELSKFTTMTTDEMIAKLTEVR